MFRKMIFDQCLLVLYNNVEIKATVVYLKAVIILASPQMEHLKQTMRQMAAAGLTPTFDGNIDPVRLRQVMQSAQGRMPTEPGVAFHAEILGGVHTELSVPENARKDAIILYIHGGGLVCGTAETSRGYASMLAAETNIPVYSLSYRLSPEHKCPAAIEDCFAVYQAIVQNYPHLPVFLIGESGGAYLSITTSLLARIRGEKKPAGVILYSPPVDLSGKLDRNFEGNKDFTVPPSGLDALGRLYYAEDSQFSDPIYTPYYADFVGFPPVYLVWDESESLAVDAVFLRRKLQQANSEVIAEGYPDCFHAFATAGRGTPESAEVLRKTVAFIHNHI